MMEYKELLPKNLKKTRWAQFFEALQSYLNEVKKEKLSVLENKFVPEKSNKENLKDLIERKGYKAIENEGFTSTLEFFKRRVECLPIEIKNLLSKKCYKYVLKSFWLKGEVHGLELDFDGFYYPAIFEGLNSTDNEAQLLDQEVDVIFYFVGPTPVPNPPIPTFKPPLFLDTFQFPNLDLDSMRSLTNHFLIDIDFYVVEDKNVFLSKETSKVLFETIEQTHRLKEVPHYRPVIDFKVKTDSSVWEKEYTTYDFDITKNSKKEAVYIKDNFSLVQYVQIGDEPYPTLNNSINQVNVNVRIYSVSGVFDIIEQSVSGIQLEYKIREYGRLEKSFGNPIYQFSEIALLNENFEAIAYCKFPRIHLYEEMYTSLKIIVYAED